MMRAALQRAFDVRRAKQTTTAQRLIDLFSKIRLHNNTCDNVAINIQIVPEAAFPY